MAASSVENESLRAKCRFRALLDVRELRPNDHPLHLFISRNNAQSLGIPDDKSRFFLSIWTNTRIPVAGSTITNQANSPDEPCIFQRMLSNSQNFPEILITDDDDSSVSRNDKFIFGMDVQIFTLATVLDPDDAHLEFSEDILLRCSKKFMPHYNIQSISVFVRPVNVYPISNAVIGVKSHETFQWLTKKEFCKCLLPEVKDSPVLIRTKDTFLASYRIFKEDPDFKMTYYDDMYILESSPLQQGLLTPKSEIVITYLGDLAAEDARFKKKLEALARKPQISGPFDYISDFTQAMNVNYLSPEVDDSNKMPAFRSKANDMKQRRTKKQEVVGKFDFDVVPQEAVFKRMLWRDEKKSNFDPLYFVGMSRKLMLKEGLFDSSFVTITPEYSDTGYDDDDDKKTNPPAQRLCMIRCLGKEYDRTTKLFISPLCLFNMVRKPPVETPESLILKRHQALDETVRTDGGRMTAVSSSWSGEPVMAKEVQISIIPSPNYSPRSPHDEALKQYFSTRRVVAMGDVLAIKSSDDPLFWQNTGEDTENRFPCIYFKVINIVLHKSAQRTSHGNYIMDKDHTMLVQIGSEHSYVPVMMQTYLSSSPLGFWDRILLPGMDSYVGQLESFILPHLTSKQGNRALQSVPPAILVAGPVGSGKTTLIVAVARRLALHAFKVNCHSLVGEASGTTEAKMLNAFNGATLYSPCILLLQSVHALGKDRDGNSDDPRVASSFLSHIKQLKNNLCQQYPMIVVATTHSNKMLTNDMQECFLHQLTIETPSEIERGEVVESLIENVNCSGNISISYIAQRTAGFVLGDLAALVAHAKREAFRRIVKLCCEGRVRPTLQEEEDLLAAGVVVQQADFQAALDQLQAAHSDAIGAPKIPNVTWDDVGGLIEVKRDILDTIQLPLQYPELLAAGLRRSGVLLYGPPGTGKTLLAKAVATECSLNFLSVKGPELINMYVGQSEQNIREVFGRARSASPCVIFFDELDSLAPNRGKSGDSGGVMDRVVSQLLAELDGLNKASDVFVIGATNRPDLLDPALLRPGRFDKMLYLGVSDDNYSQYRILSALTRKFKLAEGFELEMFVEKCPFTLTGADFYALASDAMLNALKRKIKLVDSGESVDAEIEVHEDDFLNALENLSPSVTEAELERYKGIQEQFSVNPQALGPVAEP